MKKPNNVSIRFLIFLSVCLSLFSCDKDDFPKDYVGFKDSKQTVECDRNKAEDRLEVKIIAMKKSKKDRTVLLTPLLRQPDRPQSCKLTEKQVIVKAGKDIGNNHRQNLSQTNGLKRTECHPHLYAPMERGRNQQTNHSAETEIINKKIRKR